MASTVPVALEVGVKGGAKAVSDINGIAKSMDGIAMASNVINALPIMAVVQAIKSGVSQSVDFVASFQDVSDQFDISASSSLDFTKQIRGLGGNSDKANGMLNKLFNYKKENELSGSLEDVIEKIRQTYKETQNYSELVDIVGKKNAAIFRKFLEGDGLNPSSTSAKGFDTLSREADKNQELWAGVWDNIKIGAAAAYLGIINLNSSTLSAIGTTAKTGSLTAGAKEFKEAITESYNETKKLTAEAQKLAAAEDQAVKIAKAKAAFMTDKFADEIIDREAIIAQQEILNDSIKEYMRPENFVGPKFGRNKKEDTRFNFDMSEAMSSQSSAAVVNFQKFQAAQQTTESKQLSVMSNIERYAKQTAENTRDSDLVQVLDESDFQ